MCVCVYAVCKGKLKWKKFIYISNVIENIYYMYIVLLGQYRVKSEPDEKANKGAQGIMSNIEAVKEYCTDLIELIKST